MSNLELFITKMPIDELKSFERYCMEEAGKLQRVAAKIRKEIKQRKRLEKQS